MASHRRSRLVLGAFAAPLGALLVLTGCAIGTTAEPVHETQPGVSAFEHVHALGTDPRTGNTYAATHQGVWLLPTGMLPESYLAGAPRGTSDTPAQIAGRAHDAMGFTVAAPGLLLASGHPDPAEQNDLPLPNLGLESSIDGAQTWTSISLRGETDFHDLDAVPLSGDPSDTSTLRVYGYDAGVGTVSISDDSGTTWSSGAALPLRDLAADPTNPDRVFATTADGLAVSTDAGRNFTLVDGAPLLVLIDAAGVEAGGGLFGVDPAGTIWRQDGTSEIWAQAGTTDGVPEALNVVDGATPWILVANARGIVASDDDGATWTTLVGVDT